MLEGSSKKGKYSKLNYKDFTERCLETETYYQAEEISTTNRFTRKYNTRYEQD